MKLRTLRARWARRLAGPWSRALAIVDPRAVYITLAVVLVGWMVLLTHLDRQHHLKTSTYDWMLTHRLLVPPPDLDIVLIDIDERSLAAMASEYGRWPWPRDVLATLLEELEAQGAKAVVFDILFSDADRQNPVSERTFDAAVARSTIAYFPVLRLNPANDATSAVHASQLAGLVVPRAANAAADPTLAVVLPYFDSVVRSRHLGTNNVDPDGDSVIRRYRVWEDVGDYRVLSLPARMALDFGWVDARRGDEAHPLQRQAPRVPHRELLRRLPGFPATGEDAAARRIPWLHRGRRRDRSRVVRREGNADVPHAPGRGHPGHRHRQRQERRVLPRAAGRRGLRRRHRLLVLMPYLCIRYSHEQLRLAFVIAPTVLVGISYVGMNVSKTFIDLTAPASMAFLYFSTVKVYSGQLRKRWAGDDWFAPRFEAGGRHWIGCLATTLPTVDRVAGFETRYVNLLRTVAPHARITSGLGAQSGWLGRAFNGVLVATWVEPAADDAAIARDHDEARGLGIALQTLSTIGTPLESHFEEDVLEPDDSAQPPVAAGRTEAIVADDAAAPGRRALRAVRELVTRTMLSSKEMPT